MGGICQSQSDMPHTPALPVDVALREANRQLQLVSLAFSGFYYNSAALLSFIKRLMPPSLNFSAVGCPAVLSALLQFNKLTASKV